MGDIKISIRSSKLLERKLPLESQVPTSGFREGKKNFSAFKEIKTPPTKTLSLHF